MSLPRRLTGAFRLPHLDMFVIFLPPTWINIKFACGSTVLTEIEGDPCKRIVVPRNEIEHSTGEGL